MSSISSSWEPAGSLAQLSPFQNSMVEVNKLVDQLSNERDLLKRWELFGRISPLVVAAFESISGSKPEIRDIVAIQVMLNKWSAVSTKRVSAKFDRMLCRHPLS